MFEAIRRVTNFPPKGTFSAPRDDTARASCGNGPKAISYHLLAERQKINLHLIFEPTLRFSTGANFSRPNVFVLKGSKGTPSPYVKQHP